MVIIPLRSFFFPFFCAAACLAACSSCSLRVACSSADSGSGCQWPINIMVNLKFVNSTEYICRGSTDSSKPAINQTNKTTNPKQPNHQTPNNQPNKDHQFNNNKIQNGTRQHTPTQTTLVATKRTRQSSAGHRGCARPQQRIVHRTRLHNHRRRSGRRRR